ncbi:GNAT family N-acetyltransferase [Ruegeria sp. 2012CJ41-6]|uniref:GNAT family N-acetyltransferase n=1 Tax=Ruegeria spongiae TaxID=2942209 RepID=A0ABT0Q3G7_9RHOB|nr:GNAT family N-acetyltransferase [Ruegeria spongiae]MCL6284414.1 GNAT family N-acetyltransferase [Ruegeria spongiae]
MPDTTIRQLRSFDQDQIEAHFQRLSAESLTSRFSGEVSESYVETYVSKILSDDAYVYGAFPDGHLRGLGEMRLIADSAPVAYEAALTVEPDWQHRGLGDALLSRLIIAARNRGIRELHMLCLASNQKMQNLARKHEAELKTMPGQVEATLTTPWPSPASLTEEIAGECDALVRAILHWPAHGKDYSSQPTG